MISRSTTGGGPSQRQLRVAEEVRHALADILQRGEVADPDLARHVITVPEVRMTPDLKTAMVLVMPLGGREAEAALAALSANAKALRAEIARRLKSMRSIPELRFRLDDRYDEAQKIDAMFDDPRVKRDLGKAEK